MENIPILLLNGLYYASFLFLASLGLNIILGIMGILNLAHGGLYAIGAFVAAFLIGSIGVNVLPLLVVFGGLLLALIVVGIFGFFMEISIIRPMYQRALEYQLLITFGLMLIIEGLLKFVTGGKSFYAFVNIGTINIFGHVYQNYYLFVILFTAITGVGVYLLLSKTKLGIMLRAISMDREMAQAMGIRIKLLNTMAFTIGAALAGLAGALVVGTTPATLGMGMDPLIQSFIVVVIGGLGSLRGALVGSLLVGETRSFGVSFFPEIEIAILFVIAVIILVVKPEGLFGSK